MPAGYRLAGTQAIRVDLAEKILRTAFEARALATAKHPKARNMSFRLDLALSVSIGLEAENARRLLGSAGFRCDRARALPEGAFGPPAPDRWHWRPRRPGEPEREKGERRPERREGRKDQDQPRETGKPVRGKQANKGRPAEWRPASPQTCPNPGPNPSQTRAKAFR